MSVDLEVYKSTPEFTEDTIPAGLRRAHSTRTGVWAQVVVLGGRLELRYLADDRREVLDPDRSALIEPEELHEVRALGPVRFRVDFLRRRPA